MKPTTRKIASRLLALLATVLAVLLVVVGCGGSSTSGGGGGGGSSSAAAPTASNAVMIKDFTFKPGDITVAPGTKISVKNGDKAAHTLTASDKSFDTGSIAGGETKDVTAPTKPGKYPFICTFHQYMTGTLTVS